MTDIESLVLAKLMSLQDALYRQFQIKLVPNIDPESIIGVRTPEIRRLAKELGKTPEAKNFMQALPHRYFDENNLHGLLIETIKDFDETILALDAFLPYVDNWATCDIISPKKLAKYPEKLLEHIKRWIADDKPFTVRFGIEMLMSFYLDERFRPEYLDLVSSLRSDEYYVNMMIAWFFSTALVKQYEATLRVVQTPCLDKWTHNKTIQKAIESYRLDGSQKDYLRSLKLK